MEPRSSYLAPEQEGVVPTAGPGRAAGCSKECGDFRAVEKGNDGAFESFDRDGDDALDIGGVLGVLEGREAIEGMDGGEPSVAGAATSAAAHREGVNRLMPQRSSV